jgi:hypothetical protein
MKSSTEYSARKKRESDKKNNGDEFFERYKQAGNEFSQALGNLSIDFINSLKEKAVNVIKNS